MYFQLSNKGAEWNKRAGWAEYFIYELKKFRLWVGLWVCGGGGLGKNSKLNKQVGLLDR